jgi:recombination protein RecT
MTVNNSLTQQKPKFSVAIQSEGYRNLINNTLSDPKRAEKFIAAISSAVAVNPALQECDAGTILSGALVGESLNLSPSTSLGHYYLVPYNDNANGRKVAQFQLGFKGILELAMRSGQYKRINVLSLKEGEVVSWNPLSEELKVNIIEDDDKREQLPTIAYYATFELTNGFTKSLYWSKAKMEAHATRYSKAYKNKSGSSFWLVDFDAMAYKTMLRQLLGKWGVKSTEFQIAFNADQATVKKVNKSGEELVIEQEYIDNEPTVEPNTLV